MSAAESMCPADTAQRFWAAAERHLLVYLRCRSCDRVNFPPDTDCCRWCLATDLRWEPSIGLGVVYSWTVVWRPARPALPVPYIPAIVELTEGFRMISNLVRIAPEDVRPGLPVRVCFERFGGEAVIPCFESAAATAAGFVNHTARR